MEISSFNTHWLFPSLPVPQQEIGFPEKKERGKAKRGNCDGWYVKGCALRVNVEGNYILVNRTLLSVFTNMPCLLEENGNKSYWDLWHKYSSEAYAQSDDQGCVHLSWFPHLSGEEMDREP